MWPSQLRPFGHGSGGPGSDRPASRPSRQLREGGPRSPMTACAPCLTASKRAALMGRPGRPARTRSTTPVVKSCNRVPTASTRSAYAARALAEPIRWCRADRRSADGRRAAGCGRRRSRRPECRWRLGEGQQRSAARRCTARRRRTRSGDVGRPQTSRLPQPVPRSSGRGRGTRCTTRLEECGRESRMFRPGRPGAGPGRPARSRPGR